MKLRETDAARTRQPRVEPEELEGRRLPVAIGLHLLLAALEPGATCCKVAVVEKKNTATKK